MSIAVQVAPSKCKTPALPPNVSSPAAAKISVADEPQTLNHSSFTPSGFAAAHAAPLQLAGVPLSPTANTLVGEKP